MCTYNAVLVRHSHWGRPWRKQSEKKQLALSLATNILYMHCSAYSILTFCCNQSRPPTKMTLFNFSLMMQFRKIRSPFECKVHVRTVNCALSISKNSSTALHCIPEMESFLSVSFHLCAIVFVFQYMYYVENSFL